MARIENMTVSITAKLTGELQEILRRLEAITAAQQAKAGPPLVPPVLPLIAGLATAGIASTRKLSRRALLGFSWTGR